MADLLARLQAALGSTYRLEKELGGGGMSRVFVAEELGLGRRVVVKVLPPDLPSGLNLDRFRREIHLAASLQHPNIVPLLTAGSADGLLYYTMPLIEGDSLRAKLTREGELPIGETVRLLRDVVDALSCAHEHGVVHRDIKPDNVLVSRHHALVTDFGVAKALSEATGKSSLTSTGMALGTPAYMAPEQAAADPHTDHRADIYAVGALAYEMLTGRLPFTGHSPQALLAAQLTEAPEPVTESRASVPPALAALVMRCLEMKPADRWQSAVELLQQLEAMATPSGGTTPTTAVALPAAKARTFRKSRRISAAAAAAIAVVAGLTWAVGSRPRAALDKNLIAVAPFDVLGPELELWHEGLVDLLSRNLDGAGSLRTVSPTVVIRRWSGRADPSSSAALGQQTGAGLVVYGSLVGVGTDSVKLAATLLDVSSSRPVGEVELRGETRHMDRLADSLAVGLLGELGRTRPVGAVRVAGLGAGSLPALKSFLQGEQFYRRGEWDSARVHFERAIALDTAFVPAMRRLAQSLWWGTATQAQWRPIMLRAGGLNHGLAARDSILLTADSVVTVLFGEDLPDTVRRPLTRRLLATVEEAVHRYPEDPEAWYGLGEVRVHFGWPAVAEAQVLEAFDRSIALDSAFAPAYLHPLALALVLRGSAEFSRYAKAYLALNPSGQYADAARLVVQLMDPGLAGTPRTDSLLRTASPDGLWEASVIVYRLPDSAETGVRLARELVTSRGHTGGFLEDSTFRRQFLASNLAYRGHVREARQLIQGDDELGLRGALPAELTLSGAIPRDTAAVLFGQWLRHGPFWGQRVGDPGPLFWVLPWWSGQGDSLLLKGFARRADSAGHAAPKPVERDVARYGAAAALAYLELARNDTTEALRRFAALPHDADYGGIDRIAEAQLAAAQHRDQEALGLFDRAIRPGQGLVPSVLLALERAKLAERLGERDRAVKDYQFVLDVWRKADPELQQYLAEARAGLQRLSGEGR